jgi:hypothetical protein
MENKKDNSIKILGALIALGLIVGGFFIFKGLKSFSDKDRVVEVRGLSEKEIAVNYANIKIKYSVGDNDMQSLLKTIERNNTIIVNFIKGRGLTDNEITIGVPIIKDKQNSEYGNDNAGKGYRYYSSVTISIISNKVQKVRDIEQSQFALFKEGITLKKDEYDDESTKSVYTFTKLNDIKPKMIEESIANAKIAAEQFSKNSKSKLSGIKSASQGQFEIIPTDNPLKVKIRVVSTIDFFLK